MIAEATTAIEQRSRRPATDSEVRRELGLSERVFAKWKLVSKQTSFVSFDAPQSLNGDGEVCLHESICDESADIASEDIERSERHAILAERIKDLPEKQRKVLALYYHEGLRFAEIAEVFGVSESRICQIHGQAVKALRTHMTGRSGE
jgi:RNA polymerase sigma factor for flagellar operon FliA